MKLLILFFLSPLLFSKAPGEKTFFFSKASLSPFRDTVASLKVYDNTAYVEYWTEGMKGGDDSANWKIKRKTHPELIYKDGKVYFYGQECGPVDGSNVNLGTGTKFCYFHSTGKLLGFNRLSLKAYTYADEGVLVAKCKSKSFSYLTKKTYFIPGIFVENNMEKNKLSFEMNMATEACDFLEDPNDLYEIKKGKLTFQGRTCGEYILNEKMILVTKDKHRESCKFYYEETSPGLFDFYLIPEGTF